MSCVAFSKDGRRQRFALVADGFSAMGERLYEWMFAIRFWDARGTSGGSR